MGGVPGQGHAVLGLKIAEQTGLAIDDDEGGAVVGELLGDQTAHAAVSTDNDVIAERLKLLFHSVPGKLAGQLPSHHRADGRRGGVEQGEDAGEQQAHGELTALGAELVDLMVADRGEGDDAAGFEFACHA